MNELDQSRIFAPVLAMILLTFVVWVYMYAKRLPFILINKIELDHFKPQEFERLSPDAVNNPSHNLKNLFEIPVLLYVLALILFVTGNVDKIHLITAWVFVGFRALHSLVHCTVNIVILRFYLYLASTLAVGYMAVRAGMQILL